MLLSGILLKLGFYGVVKYCLGLFGGALFGVGPILLTLALVGAFATALSTYRQLDLKKIIAYSSVVHMNLSLFGYLTLSAVALQAALFLNLSHALISAGLFNAVGLLQERSRSRNLLELAGLGTVLPLWSQCTLLLLLANAGLPGTAGFIGEAPLVWGCYIHYPYAATLLLLPLSLMGVRSFLLYAQLCWGVAHGHSSPTPLRGGGTLLRSWDLSLGRGEGVALALCSGGALLLGVWPQPLLGLLDYAALQSEVALLAHYGPGFRTGLEQLNYLEKQDLLEGYLNMYRQPVAPSADWWRDSLVLLNYLEEQDLLEDYLNVYRRSTPPPDWLTNGGAHLEWLEEQDLLEDYLNQFRSSTSLEPEERDRLEKARKLGLLLEEMWTFRQP